MSSKLRKALGAWKDQTSISLAKVTNAANLEVIILKATTHDPTPIENRYVNEILQLVSSNKVYAAACAQAISKRIGKTRNWVVALKSLMLVLRIFQDGDPYFPREVFHAMKKGAKILNLSSFRDDSNSNPWDYTTFVRTFALYLDERLDCFLTGKLQRRFNYHNQIHDKNYRHMMSNEPGIKDMKPIMLLDRISYWQKLLDRAIATRPTGSARTNRLVQISLYAIVRESFDLCKDISDGLTVILDSFFELPYQACVSAFQACVKSSKQFDELSAFYSLCTSIGIGRTSEYPSMEKVSDEVIETLKDFLKDQALNTIQSPFSNKNMFLSTPRDLSSSSEQDEAYERYMTPKERSFENMSEYESQRTSLEDLMCATDVGFSPRASIEQDMSSNESDQDDKQSQDDFSSANDDFSSTHSLPTTTRSSLELVSLDDYEKEDQQKNQIKECWELVLIETTTKSNHEASQKLANGFDPFSFDAFFDQFSIPQHHYNPFLEDVATVAPSNTNVGNQINFMDLFDAEPTFQAIVPTFCDQNPNDAIAPTFHAQNSNDTTIAPTFNNTQTSNFDTDLALLFHNLNPNDMAIAPTFRAQSSIETNVVPSFKARKKFNMEPTFSTQESINTNMVQGFQYQNLDMMPSFKAQKEFNMTPTFNTQELTNTNMTQGFQYQNSNMTPSFIAQKEFNMTPIFSAQDLTNTNMTQGCQSHNLDMEPSFKAKKEFNMAPIFSTQDSTNTNIAWSVQSQNPDIVLSFKSQKEFNMTPKFSAQDSTNTNIAQGFQSHNSDTTLNFKDKKKFNMTPTFNAQESKNSNLARGFQCQNLDTIPSIKAQKEYIMAPIFGAQDSTNTNIAQGFQSQNSNIMSSFKAQKKINMALTFNAQESINTNMAQDLQSQNPYMVQSFEAQMEFNMAPTFNVQDSTNSNMTQGFQSYYLDEMPSFEAQKQSITTPTFSLQDSTNMNMAEGFQSYNPYTIPSFKAQEFNMTPTFNGQNSRNINKAQGFHSLDSDVLAFYSNSSFENGSTPTFYAQSLDRRRTIPTFSSQDFNVAITSPSFATQNHKNSILGAERSFQMQNFNQTMVAPSFSATNFDEMTRATYVQDNPFEPWSSGMANEYTSNHSMQEQNFS